MKMNKRTFGEVLCLDCDEIRLDASVAADFKGEIIDLINQGTRKLIINLSKVEFMDSSGLSALVSILKNMNLAGGKVALCSVTKGVEPLFRITRMDKAFTVYPDEEKALEDF